MVSRLVYEFLGTSDSQEDVEEECGGHSDCRISYFANGGFAARELRYKRYQGELLAREKPSTAARSHGGLLALRVSPTGDGDASSVSIWQRIVLFAS